MVPAALHAFHGPDPFVDPCAGSDAMASFTGDLNVTVNNNDQDNAGSRANSFGDRGRGTIRDQAGAAFHYSWNFRAVWSPDATTFTIKTEKLNLGPIGKQ